MTADTIADTPPAADDAPAYPAHWRMVQLADERVFSIENGIWTGEKGSLIECPVIRNTNFTDDGDLNLSNVAVIHIEARQINKKRLLPGDIVVERSGGGPQQPVGRVAYFDQVGEDYCFSNFTSRIRIVDERMAHARFLHLYLLYFHMSGQTERLQRRTTGIRNLAFADYKAEPIPLPPLPEQRAIACVLRAAQNAITTRRREVTLERERKAALMQRLFTHGTRGEQTKQTRFGTIPASWEVTALDNCAYVQTGVAKGRRLDGRQVVSLPYLRVANVQDGFLDLTEIKEIVLTKDEVGRYRLQSGDVLLTEGGDFDKLGRGFVWHGQVADCVHQNHIFAVRADASKLLSDFLAYLIQSDYGKAYFLSVAHRTTNLASINSTKLKALPTLLPTLEEQRAIADTLAACDAHIAALEREIALHEELFRALLEELMSGRLSALPLVKEIDMVASEPAS